MNLPEKQSKRTFLSEIRYPSISLRTYGISQPSRRSTGATIDRVGLINACRIMNRCLGFVIL